MPPSIVVAILASVVSLGAIWPRSVTQPSVSGTTFVAFALWTIDGALLDRSAIVATGAICLVITTLALSARALFGTWPRASRA